MKSTTCTARMTTARSNIGDRRLFAAVATPNGAGLHYSRGAMRIDPKGTMYGYPLLYVRKLVRVLNKSWLKRGIQSIIIAMVFVKAWQLDQR